MHSSSATNFFMIIVTIAFTALCWGSYGPLLQLGHGDMGSGRLRPFICVGVAYFFVAIVGPLVLMTVLGQESSQGLFHGWTFTGILWSLAGGAAGALGAFGIILALNYGGAPTTVMPLVFGIAPVVNTFIMIGWKNKWAEFGQNPFFPAGLILVAAGAVTVLLSAPSFGPPKHAQAPKESAKPESEQSKPADKEAKSNTKEESSETPAVDPPQPNS